METKIRFAEVEIYMSAEGEIVLRQPEFGSDDQVVGFPPHQAKAICTAILKLAKEHQQQ